MLFCVAGTKLVYEMTSNSFPASLAGQTLYLNAAPLGKSLVKWYIISFQLAKDYVEGMYDIIACYSFQLAYYQCLLTHKLQIIKSADYAQ